MAVKKYSTFVLWISFPIIFVLTHHLSMLPHEYFHSFMGWLLGFKENPFLLDYGHLSLSNIFFLHDFDENINYFSLYLMGHRNLIALVAFAGPGLANGILFFVALYLLRNASIQKNNLFYFFIYWFYLMNLGNFLDYIPVRTFTTHGDVGNFSFGLNISPWVSYIIFGYLVFFACLHFFRVILIEAYYYLEFQSIFSKCILIIISTAILLLFTTPGLTGYGNISNFLSLNFFVMAPGILYFCWPSRTWVKVRLAYLPATFR